MKLEDFLTLSEMSKGFTSPARVQELVSIMQKDRDRVVNNAHEVARQWSAVASTIIATENKECLELFIQLDGLCFIQSWLKDAVRFGGAENDYFVKETVNHLIAYLLRAVERLHVDAKKSVSSGIWETVKSLLGHKSSKVQERAKVLLDSWDKGKDEAKVSVGIEKQEASNDDGTREAVKVIEEQGRSEPLSRDEAGSGEEKEQVGNNKIPSSQSNDIHQSRVGETRTSDQNLGCTQTKDALPSSPLANSVTEDRKVEDPTCRAEGATNAIDTCTLAVTRPGAPEEQTDASVSDSVCHLNHIKELRGSEKINSAASKPLEDTGTSLGTDTREASDAVTGSELHKQTDAYDEDNCRGKSSCGDASVAVPMENTLLDDDRPANHGKSSRVLETKEDRKYSNDKLQDSDENNLEHPIDSLIARADKQSSDGSEDDNESESEEAEKGGQDSGMLGKKSDIELDYGIMDPLEVARQVAMEVEREVEQSCSSSEKIKETKVHESDSPDSMTATQRQKVECSNKEVSRVPACLAETSPANTDAGPVNGTEKVESSHVVDAPLDLETNVDKGLCNFDLNLCSDDIDISENPLSNSISVVSASRAAAAPGVPVTPLQFEGTLGWKGSAATSAFRPASPRRIPESEKGASSHGTDSSSKQLPGCHDIDLNASEGGDDRVADLFPVKQVSELSVLPVGESSAEASSKKLGRLDLDLNCASEVAEAPSDWRMEGRLFSLRNGHQSRSPSSSSSSKLMNFDLNDQPSLLNDFSDLNNFKRKSQNVNASGGVKSGDSVVSIMGMKVEVNRRDFAAQSFPILNSRVAENAVDHDVASSGGVLGLGSPFQFTYPPPFGYNGITPGPPMAFPSSMYGPSGPIPYMMDSRGSPVGHQFLGSASAIPPAFAQQPFFVSMGGASVANGVGPSRSGMDLNTGLMLDGRSRDLGGLRQFLDQEQVRPMDEHFRTVSQPSTSLSIGGKRKEPDSGWEPYPFKQHPPPWK